MKYNIITTSQFNKDFKRAKKRGYNMDNLQEVIKLLAVGESLPAKYNDHTLKGNYNGYRECHIQPDWLLIYKIVDETLLLSLFRTGTHSDLF